MHDARYAIPRGRLFAAAAVLALLPYLGTLGHGFAYDDALNVSANPLVREHRFAEIATRPFHVGAEVRVETGAWRPLTTWSFAANHALSGERPLVWHATNLFLHLAATLALLAVALSLGLPGATAFAAAALFATHPLHVEVVANVSNRTESLQAAACLAALAAYLRWRDGRRTGVAALPLLAAALLAKETAVVFLTLAAAAEWTGTPRPGARRRLSAVAAVTLGYLAARHAVLGGITAGAANVTSIENPVASLAGLERIATALAVLGRGAGLLVLPWPLTPDYGHAHTVPGISAASAAGALLLAGALAAIVVAVRRRSTMLLPLVLLVAPWLLVSNLFVTIGTVFGERLLYLPSAGFVLGLVQLVRSRALLAAALAAGTLLSAWQASYWKSDAVLFAHAEKAAPDSVRVLVNLGGDLALAGDLDGAERRLRRALELAPDLVPARINLGATLLRRGDAAGAEREARRALEIDPGSVPARRLLEAVTPRASSP